MSDREVYYMNVMGCKWCIQLHHHDHGFDNKNYWVGYPNIGINFSKMGSADELIVTVFDALFDSVIEKFCGEDWDSKLLANVVSQVFLEPKSRRVIDDMCTYFSRNHLLGEEYDKFNSNGELKAYMFDSIEIKKPYYWGFEIWIANLEGDTKFEFSRFGMTEEYVFRVDPTKFESGQDIIDCMDEVLAKIYQGNFEGLEDVQPSYTYEQLNRKLRTTNLEDIKKTLIEEYDDIVTEFEK